MVFAASLETIGQPGHGKNLAGAARVAHHRAICELAEQTLLKAKDAKPNDPAVYMQLAGYYNRQGDFAKTMEALDQRVVRRHVGRLHHEHEVGPRRHAPALLNIWRPSSSAP